MIGKFLFLGSIIIANLMFFGAIIRDVLGAGSSWADRSWYGGGLYILLFVCGIGGVLGALGI